MSQLELLKKTLSVLDAHNIEYMLVGSFVSSLYGEPRSTQDIDMIVSINRNHIANLIREFCGGEASITILDKNNFTIEIK